MWDIFSSFFPAETRTRDATDRLRPIIAGVPSIIRRLKIPIDRERSTIASGTRREASRRIISNASPSRRLGELIGIGEMPYVAREPRSRAGEGTKRGPPSRRNSRLDGSRGPPFARGRENLAGHDVPVDLLRRFSHPAGSSSSAIAAVVFSDCFAALFPGTRTSNAARRHRAERRAERRRGLPTSGDQEAPRGFLAAAERPRDNHVKRSNVTPIA